MRIGYAGRWLALGSALVLAAGCEAADRRFEQFGKLADSVIEQINTEILGKAPADPLMSAPLDARALNGVQVQAVELQPVSLDEMLGTQTFFAVGSVIAKPREEMVESVVEDAELDAMVSEDSAAGNAAELDPATESSNETAVATPAPDSAPEPAPAVRQRAGALERAEVEPPRPVAPPPAPVIVEAPNELAPPVEIPDAVELRRRAQTAPRNLQKAVTDRNVPVTRDSLRVARRLAERQGRKDSDSAQEIGDELVRRSKDAEAPVPKALAVRSKLKINEALSARDRAYNKLEEMGLSGVVTPDEGGQMRITIGVDPTKFEDGAPIDPTRVNALAARFARLKQEPQDECAGNPTREQLQADPVLATECVVMALRETGEYEYVEKDYMFAPQILRRPKNARPVTTSYGPNDPLYGLQWHFKNQGAGEGQSVGGASFADFWERAKVTGSRSVTVAVIDTGLQMNHPDIAGSANLGVGFDMVSDPAMGNDGDGRDPDPHDPGDRCDPSDPTTSDTFHGTHVAGTIGVAATNNANGIAGGAWDVTIVPVRALGRCGGRLSDINDAIRWAAGKVPARDALGAEIWVEDPADIINLSIGLFEPCPASMQAAIDDAVAAGAIVVTAAGNARIDTKYFAPGGCRNVISVAASDARGVLTPYSNFGDDVDIMAPGGDMSRDDDGDGRPDGVLSTKFATDCYDPAAPDTQVAECYYAYENGTSMAAPHVSAALALLKARFPTAVPSDLRSRLLAASTPRSAAQCSGKCSAYPGTSPIPGQDGMCYRPCGASVLNLANAALQ